MRNLATLWRDTVNAYSDRVLVKWLNKKDICEKTYGEMDADITKVRKGLASLGYSASHIALIGETSPYWICCYFGIVTGDNVAVPLDANLPAEELIDLLNRSDSEALFISPKLEAVASAAKEKCPKLKNIWFLEEETEGKETMATVMASARDKDAKEPGEDDVVTIIFTSGTTGKSKGVVLTHRNLYDNVENVEYVGKDNGTTLSVLPIHHAYCLVMDWLKTLSIGTTVCINDSFMHMIRNMSIFNPSTMLMVPMMIETIYKKLQVTKDPVSANVFGKNLETIYTGGAHLDPFYIDEFAKYGIEVIEGYGMSECSPVISTNVKGKNKPGSIGKPLKNV
ncbi:MAG: acyl--CoA ligase, partial [Lachnospiraceae bacterium]|nr:acyl--CoA ligase [Lachnospiraceae bacterium]